jgi:hypothetical protein
VTGLLLWLSGAWLVLRGIRAIEERNAILDRQERAKRERLSRRDAGEEIALQSVVDRIRQKWVEADVRQRLERHEIEEPLPFRRRAS